MIALHYTTHRIEDTEAVLIPIGDVHIGAETSRADEVLKLITAAGDNVRFIFLGDVIDNALTTSVSDTYTATCTPEEALMKGFKQLIDAADGKIIGAVGGNHEERTTRAVGVDLTRVICEQHKIPYSQDILIFDLYVGTAQKPACYTVVAAHGRGGGRTTGGKINAAARLKEVYPNGDVYITGHTHQPSHWKSSYFEIDKRNKMLSKRSRYHVVIPAWLGYEHYAANRFYPPSSDADLEIRLSGQNNNKRIRVEVV